MEIEGKHFLNPGSVGQPRDGNTDAAFAILDTSDFSAELQRVPYDIEKTISNIEESGLHEEVAVRLKNGN